MPINRHHLSHFLLRQTAVPISLPHMLFLIAIPSHKLLSILLPIAGCQLPMLLSPDLTNMLSIIMPLLLSSNNTSYTHVLGQIPTLLIGTSLLPSVPEILSTSTSSSNGFIAFFPLAQWYTDVYHQLVPFVLLVDIQKTTSTLSNVLIPVAFRSSDT